MALRRVRRRRRASITSLIDVIFLLLLFFMLASTFSEFSEIEISSAASAKHAENDPHVIRVVVTDNGIDLEGKTVLLRNLSTELRNLDVPNGTSVIAVDVSDEATAQHLIDAVSLIRTFDEFDVMVMEPS